MSPAPTRAGLRLRRVGGYDELIGRVRDLGGHLRRVKEAARQERSPEREQGFAHLLDKPREHGKQARRGDE